MAASEARIKMEAAMHVATTAQADNGQLRQALEQAQTALAQQAQRAAQAEERVNGRNNIAELLKAQLAAAHDKLERQKQDSKDLAGRLEVTQAALHGAEIASGPHQRPARRT